MDGGWMDDDISEEVAQQGHQTNRSAAADAPPPLEDERVRREKQPTSKQAQHDARMQMKLEQKLLRDGNGAASLRIKPGAKISEKQWARLDDRLREKVVKSGGMPPYKVAAAKKKKNSGARVSQSGSSLAEKTT
jgi:hypothetical protein